MTLTAITPKAPPAYRIKKNAEDEMEIRGSREQNLIPLHRSTSYQTKQERLESNHKLRVCVVKNVCGWF